MKRGYLFFILLISLVRCADEDPINTEIGLSYFPLHTGQSWIYRVEETIINQTMVSNSYELRVAVVDSAKNASGGFTYTFNRAKRTAETEPWESFETWTAEVNGNQLVQNEGNELFVKLIFPVSDKQSWNGNQFNNLPNSGNLFNGIGSDAYHVAEYKQSKALTTNLSFDDTITIIQNDFDDPIVGKDIRKEVYAFNVGLIFKEITQLEYCSIGDCLGQEKVDRGFVMTQTLKSHGAQ